MDAPAPTLAAMEAIRHWSRLIDLAEFALCGRGFGDSDGGFGVTYPNDLDEYDREVAKRVIPAGYVEVYGYWGHPNGYEMLIPEQTYLSVLAATLAAAGHQAQAAQLQLLLDRNWA